MSEQRLDVKKAMRVFHLVQTHGEKKAQAYHWQQLEASSDFDGYTLFLKFRSTTLTLFFHHKYHIDLSSRQELDAFFELLDTLDKQY